MFCMGDIKEMLFVVMPFGKKMNPSGTVEIDFDRIYEQAIHPAAVAADLDVIRADEEQSAGIIHTPMFERLLASELVVADLTIPNPNVYYELGVRHTARPRTTILMFAPQGPMPFDINMLRGIPYQLDNGRLTDDEALRLREILTEKFRLAVQRQEDVDSPLFQLLDQFPGVVMPPESLTSFRERSRGILALKERMGRVRRMNDERHALDELSAVEKAAGEITEAESEVVLELLFSYRDVKAYTKLIELADRIPAGPLAESQNVRELKAFALNRRNQPGDREQAVAILKGIVRENKHGALTLGMLGRIYKDYYGEADEKENRLEAEIESEIYLDEAIKWYRRGFEYDPREFYPGINLATLLFIKGDEASMTELPKIAYTVVFAAERRGGLESEVYWDPATILGAAVLAEDWKLAEQAARKMYTMKEPPWKFETTRADLENVRDTREERELDNTKLEKIIKIMDLAARRSQ